jgi:hypothetical protein
MKHLQEKRMSYFGHMYNALRFARYSIIVATIYFLGAIRYTVHAFIPALFGNTTAEWIVKKQVQAGDRLRT